MSAVKYIFMVLALCLVKRSIGNYKAHFPLSDKNRYPRLVFGAVPTLNEFTFCSWVRPLRLNVEYPYIFSYATQRDANELTVLLQKVGENSFLGYVQLGKPYVSFECSFVNWKIGSWQHICASWLGADGSTKFFANGQQCSAAENVPISPGGYILGGGVAMIGQDQDEVSGSFDPNQAWYGDMSNANLWSEVLNENQILEASKCHRKRKEGNIIAWSKSTVSAYDGVVLTDSVLCEP